MSELIFVTLDRRIVVPGPHGLDPDDSAAMPQRAIAVYPDDSLPLARISDTSNAGAPPRGFYALSPAAIERLRASGRRTFEDFERAAAALLARRTVLVERVWRLRVAERRTWRGVARALTLEEPVVRSWSDLAANQLVGLALCKGAAQRLGQDFMEPPWN